MRVLALGTYPIARPIHGGQRRIAALHAGYVRHNIPYKYLAVVDGSAYAQADRRQDDIPLGQVDPRYDPMWQIGDVRSGMFGARNDLAFQQIVNVARRFGPTHVQLEHPFMFPVFQRLKAHWPEDDLQLIYSAHQVESRVKRGALEELALPEPFVDEIGKLVEEWERAACGAAQVVIAVCADDAEQFRQWGAAAVVVARNGASYFPRGALQGDAAEKLGGKRYLITVGSDRPPNVSGFLQLLAAREVGYGPVHPLIVVCGGMVDGLGRRAEFQEARGKGDRRFVVVADPVDKVLGALQNSSHGFLLPIRSGGGANLRTAEALVSGRHVIGTRLAFRGFEEFRDAPGVHLAETALEFRAAITDVLGAPPLELGDAELNRRDQLLRWSSTLKPYFDHIAPALAEAAPMPASAPGDDIIGFTMPSNVARFSGRPRQSAAGLELEARYDQEAVQVMRRVLHRESNAIDVGCDEGGMLQTMLQFAPRGTHHAFEPRPELFERLRRRYGHLPNVRLHELALSGSRGASALKRAPANPDHSGLGARRHDRPDEQPEEISVRADTLDNAIPADLRVDFIKVDAQGAELLVFKGALATIGRSRPVIVFRHGRAAAECYGAGPEDMHDLLALQCGLRLSLMAEWLENDEAPGLGRDAFADEVHSGRNDCFIAY